MNEYDLYDTLNPYETAILSFTKVPDTLDFQDAASTLILTTKDSYLLAGTLAHIIVRRSEDNFEELLNEVKRTIYEYFETQADDGWLDGTKFRYWHPYENIRSYFLLDFLLMKFDLLDERKEILENIEDAVKSLVWREIIQDPFTKKICGILLSVVMVCPVSFTSTGPQHFNLNSLTWEYSSSKDEDRVEREVRIKVKELTEVVLDILVPAAISAFDLLSENETSPDLSIERIQLILRAEELYKGQVDNLIGPETSASLRKFQRIHNIKETGYPDDRTLQILKSIDANSN